MLFIIGYVVFALVAVAALSGVLYSGPQEDEDK